MHRFAAKCAVVVKPLPPPLRPAFIPRDPVLDGITKRSPIANTFHESLKVTDVSIRPLQWNDREGYRPIGTLSGAFASGRSQVNVKVTRYSNGQTHVLRDKASPAPTSVGASYGDSERVQSEQLTMRWGKMFFGNVFHGPRNYSYRGSRWYLRRFQMKKHRYKKRWTHRRYKLAAIANLPHARMIRISMLPEIRKASTVSASGSDGSIADVVSSAFQNSGQKKSSGRSRPYSTWQS